MDITLPKDLKEKLKLAAPAQGASYLIEELLNQHFDNVTQDTLKGLRKSFVDINHKLSLLAELTTKIADKAQVGYNQDNFNDWGA